MLDDSFGTEKLHLKEREISPKKEEVASEPVREEKVDEIDQNDTKKADIERRRNEAKKGLEMLYDMEIRKAMQDLPVRQQGLAANRL